MSLFQKKDLPLALMTILGVFILFAYYIPIPATTQASNTLTNWVGIMGTYTIFLGTITLVYRELQTVTKREMGWPASILFFIVLIAGTVLYFYSGGSGKEPYYTFFTTIFEPADGAIWSTLAFMVAGAFFRVFRIRTWESALLVIACVFVVLTNATIGEYIWPGFPQIGSWILQVPAFGAAKGSAICVALGAIVLGMRIILGYEKRVM